MVNERPDQLAVDEPVQIIVFKPVLDRISESVARSSVEVGGKLFGRLMLATGRTVIQIETFVDSGPKASRSTTHIYPDGAYQEAMYRVAEHFDPEIEHLGTWHSHHPNGLGELSGGDVRGYLESVNDNRYQPPYFLAILVTGLDMGQPLVKYYLFTKGEKDYTRLRGDTVLVYPRRHPTESILAAAESVSDAAQGGGRSGYSVAPLQDKPSNDQDLTTGGCSVSTSKVKRTATRLKRIFCLLSRKRTSIEPQAPVDRKCEGRDGQVDTHHSAPKSLMIQAARAEDNRWLKDRAMPKLKTLRDSRTGAIIWTWEASSTRGPVTIRYTHPATPVAISSLLATLEMYYGSEVIAKEEVELDETRFDSLSNVLRRWGVAMDSKGGTRGVC